MQNIYVNSRQWGPWLDFFRLDSEWWIGRPCRTALLMLFAPSGAQPLQEPIKTLRNFCCSHGFSDNQNFRGDIGVISPESLPSGPEILLGRDGIEFKIGTSAECRPNKGMRGGEQRAPQDWPLQLRSLFVTHLWIDFLLWARAIFNLWMALVVTVSRPLCLLFDNFFVPFPRLLEKYSQSFTSAFAYQTKSV